MERYDLIVSVRFLIHIHTQCHCVPYTLKQRLHVVDAAIVSDAKYVPRRGHVEGQLPVSFSLNSFLFLLSIPSL